MRCAVNRTLLSQNRVENHTCPELVELLYFVTSEIKISIVDFSLFIDEGSFIHLRNPLNPGHGSYMSLT